MNEIITDLLKVKKKKISSQNEVSEPREMNKYEKFVISAIMCKYAKEVEIALLTKNIKRNNCGIRDIDKGMVTCYRRLSIISKHLSSNAN